MALIQRAPTRVKLRYRPSLGVSLGAAASSGPIADALATKAASSVIVSGAGLASGGGTLAANRTITVPKSSQVQAQAGTDDATAMTPARTSDAITALSSAVSYAAGQIAPTLQVSPTARPDPARWATRKAIAGLDFGVPADTSTDAGVVINTIMAALDERGGGILELPPVNLLAVTEIDNKYNRVLVDGGAHGVDVRHNVSAPRYGTTIVAGTANMKVCRRRSPYGDNTTPVTTGGGFRGIRVVGNGKSDINLEVDSVSGFTAHMDLENAVAGVGGAGAVFKCAVEGTNFGESPCVQSCDVDLKISQIDSTAASNATCIKLMGSSNANVSVIDNFKLDLLHYNGHALEIFNADNIFFYQRSYKVAGGGGLAVLSHAGQVEGERARVNKWRYLSCNAPVVFEGTEVAPWASSGRILPGALDLANGTPLPTLGTGAVCPVDGVVYTYSPLVQALVSGTPTTLTSYTSSGRWIYNSGFITCFVSVSIVTNGPGGGFLLVSLPMPSAGQIEGFIGGSEIALTGKPVKGTIGTQAAFRYTDDSYPGANGTSFRLMFAYEPFGDR